MRIFRGVESLNAPLTQFVRQCVVNLLSNRAFLALLANCMGFLPDSASPADIDALTMKIKALIEEHNPILLECQVFDEPSTWGRTVRTASGMISVYISKALTTALEVTPLDAPNSPLLATLAVTKIVHQLCHWMRFLLSGPMATPTPHVSHSAYEESGYALEIATSQLLSINYFRNEEHTLTGGQVSRVKALCLEAGPLWTAEQIKCNDGPPPTEYCLVDIELGKRLFRMKDGEELSFPMFNIANLDVVGKHWEYDMCYRVRDQCKGEEQAPPRVLYGLRRPSSCRDDRDEGVSVSAL
ncbi:hypothetical protein MSAN_00722100 [Mycena sanguinolenta]|uniref:Uncharacterized protein n=1 Tax=Mycena sanguinolenta TaxID=230812 RepID=A0A8H6Z544_9AGAR|nr:hypothetical protein MSAN_00722100 [Mycena sanguinolenta]